MEIRNVRNTSPPFHFQTFSEGMGVTQTISASKGGVDCKICWREAPESYDKSAVLENFSDFSENLFLRNEIKSKTLDILGKDFFSRK